MVRKYRGYVTCEDNTYYVLDYYSQHRNYSKMNMNDFKDAFYKKYGMNEYKKVICFDFGYLLD